jgi:hypothetical protein
MEEEKGCRKGEFLFLFFFPLPVSPLFSACCFEFGLDPSPPKTPERCQLQRLFNANVFIANAFFLFVIIKRKIGFRIVSKIKYSYKKERKKVFMKEEDRAKETKKRKRRS